MRDDTATETREPRPVPGSLAPLDDDELYHRGAATLLSSWEEYARGANGAAVQRLAGVATAIFHNEPERSIYNNALLERGLTADARGEAIAAMESAYRHAGVRRFAAWVHESDQAMRSDLVDRGYRVDEVTRAMGMELDDIRVLRSQFELEHGDWSEHLRVAELPRALLTGIEPGAFHILVGSLRGERVSTGIAFDHGRDCGIYNVGTLKAARRRGLATALMTMLLHDAVSRGCRTASLQSTAMAERVYAAVGFRDLGRILEYVPPL